MLAYPVTMDPHGLLGHLRQLLPVQLCSPGVVLLLGISCCAVVLMEEGSLEELVGFLNHYC